MKKYLTKVILLQLALLVGEAVLIYVGLSMSTISLPCGEYFGAPCPSPSTYPAISSQDLLRFAMVAYLIVIFLVIGILSYRYYRKRLEINGSNAIGTIIFVCIAVILLTAGAYFFITYPNVLLSIVTSDHFRRLTQLLYTRR